MTTLYSPGEAPVAVTRHGIVALAPGADHALVARIWTQVSSGRGLAGVLEALTTAYGASLAAIPPFAVAVREGDALRLAVRGAVEVEVEARDGSRIVTGAGVTTWTESLIAGVTRLVIASHTAHDPAELPVQDAVVLAARIEWAVAGESTGAGDAPVTVIADPEESAGSHAKVVERAERDEASRPDEAAHPADDAGRAGDAGPAGPADRADDADPAGDDLASADTVATSRPKSRKSIVSADGPEPAVPPKPPVPPVPIGLIDSATVQSLTTADTLLPAESTLIPVWDDESPADESAPAGPAAPGEEPLDATVVVRGGGARGAASPVPAPTPPVPPTPPPAGDHDGETISLVQARALRAQAAAARQDAGSADSAPIDSAPIDSAPIDSAPIDSAPPPLAPPRPPAPGRIRVSTGQVLLLDRTVIIGRRPRSTRVTGTDLPHLVAVESPQQDISRSHVELRVEGDSIVATDLHTTNGTTLLRAGNDPVRLHPGEVTVVVPGDVIDLGDGITVAVEELP